VASFHPIKKRIKNEPFIKGMGVLLKDWGQFEMVVMEGGIKDGSIFVNDLVGCNCNLQ